MIAKLFTITDALVLVPSMAASQERMSTQHKLDAVPSFKVGTTPATQAVDLGLGPHLFIDDYLIAAQSTLKRSVHHPKRLPQPVVTGKEDKNFQPYVTVLRDPNTGRFRM